MLSKLLRRVTKKASLTHSPKLNEIESFYSRTLERFDASYRGVGWSRKSTQEIRFMILSLIADIKDARILDMGCGTGDFFAYLVENGFVFLIAVHIDYNINLESWPIFFLLMQFFSLLFLNLH